MHSTATNVDAISSRATKTQRWPARLDVLQGATGLALGLFMLVHTLFAATILLGVDAMAALARALEGYYLLGRSVPAIVTAFTLTIFTLFVVHAVLAMRKAPSSFRAFERFWTAMANMRHSDTNLWAVQVVSGYVIMFLATVHLYTVLANPDALGPLESADQVWSGRMWLLYVVLLPATELHVGVGLYRLAVKWGWFFGARPDVARRRLKRAMWALIVTYVTLGFASLAAYARLGAELASGQHDEAASHAANGLPCC